MKSVKLFLANLIAIVVLASCSVLPDSVLPDHELIANIKATDSINPSNGQANPVYVLIFQLKDPSSFNNANFFDLYENPVQTIGADLLGVEKVYIAPGEKFGLSIPLKKDVQEIGVVAAYKDISHSQWRTLIKLNSTYGKESAWITLDGLTVTASTN